MEDFEQRVERFFKQFRSCLGIEPDLRASFVSKDISHLFEEDDDDYCEIIESPRLPFELTEKDKQQMGEEWHYVDLDHERKLLFEKWEVDPKYKVNTEIIKIRKAMDTDKLDVSQALLIIDDYASENWKFNGGDDYDISRLHINFTQSIFDNIKDWMNGRRDDLEEVIDNDLCIRMFIDELNQKRNTMYNRLIRAIKDEPIVEKEDETIRTSVAGHKWIKVKELDFTPEDKQTEPQDNFSFTNKFDHVETDVIYKHFKKGLVDPGYLGLEELHKYLKLAFELLEQPKEDKFRFSNPNIGLIQTTFATYYYSIAGKPSKKQYSYVDLLNNYFHNFPKRTTLYRNWYSYQ